MQESDNILDSQPTEQFEYNKLMNLHERRLREENAGNHDDAPVGAHVDFPALTNNTFIIHNHSTTSITVRSRESTLVYSHRYESSL